MSAAPAYGPSPRERQRPRFYEAAAFININTPGDLARAEALLARSGPLRNGLR